MLSSEETQLLLTEIEHIDSKMRACQQNHMQINERLEKNIDRLAEAIDQLRETFARADKDMTLMKYKVGLISAFAALGAFKAFDLLPAAFDTIAALTGIK